MYSISCQRADDYSDLESTWREIERRAKTPVFLSWSWIKYVLSLASSDLHVLSVKADDKVVGICLFCIKETRLFHCLPIKQCYINRYGSNAMDQMWIEYNDFLVDHSDEATIKSAMLNYFFSNKLADEVVLGMSDIKSTYCLTAVSDEIKTRSMIQSYGYFADLRDCHTLEDYLNTLSKNTRSQIKRSHKLLHQAGRLELREALSQSEKLDFFMSAGALHRQRWADTEFGTGFNNPNFVRFHESLITDQHQASRIFRLSLDDEALGYIYVLVEAGKWLFYLSALNFHQDNRIKLGLVFHCLVIEQAIQHQIDYYDFLAGDARYKQSLSNSPHYQQDLICFYQKTIYLDMIDLIRKFKQKIKSACNNITNKVTPIQAES